MIVVYKTTKNSPWYAVCGKDFSGRPHYAANDCTLRDLATVHDGYFGKDTDRLRAWANTELNALAA